MERSQGSVRLARLPPNAHALLPDPSATGGSSGSTGVLLWVADRSSEGLGFDGGA